MGDRGTEREGGSNTKRDSGRQMAEVGREGMIQATQGTSCFSSPTHKRIWVCSPVYMCHIFTFL